MLSVVGMSAYGNLLHIHCVSSTHMLHLFVIYLDTVDTVDTVYLHITFFMCMM